MTTHFLKDQLFLILLGKSAEDDDDDDGPTEEQCKKYVTKACQKESGRMKMMRYQSILKLKRRMG